MKKRYKFDAHRLFALIIIRIINSNAIRDGLNVKKKKSFVLLICCVGMIYKMIQRCGAVPLNILFEFYVFHIKRLDAGAHCVNCNFQYCDLSLILTRPVARSLSYSRRERITNYAFLTMRTPAEWCWKEGRRKKRSGWARVLAFHFDIISLTFKNQYKHANEKKELIFK